MHNLAERNEHEKKICEEDVQDQHKGMAGKGNTGWQVWLQIEETGEVRSIVFDGQAIIFIPGSRPIHLTTKKNGQKEQDEEIVILRHRDLSIWRHKTPEEKVDQSNAKDQANKAPAQEHPMFYDLKDLEFPDEFQMTDDQKQKGDMEEHQKDP